jgi:hypothetical protein
VETEIEDFNKVGCLSNLMAKYGDTNEWVALVSNKIFASKEQTIRICLGVDVFPLLLYLAFLNCTIRTSS